jgi:hypothetical protein
MRTSWNTRLARTHRRTFTAVTAGGVSSDPLKITIDPAAPEAPPTSAPTDPNKVVIGTGHDDVLTGGKRELARAEGDMETVNASDAEIVQALNENLSDPDLVAQLILNADTVKSSRTQ